MNITLIVALSQAKSILAELWPSQVIPENHKWLQKALSPLGGRFKISTQTFGIAYTLSSDLQDMM